ncbi:OLC1v1034380C2 [Oldenlandia corymbosa var. corymbosa]|uniref:Beta-galactosidase n=1 Tax=Oldenlandia corymbosa var. corymbosa TaxID=529605 RepID=A0AAV1CR75_OLDCO|nr:OLC1v1034380C2 [Oldenlandia corymbosa var. corymbosa]
MGKYPVFFIAFTIVFFAFCCCGSDSANISYDGRALKINGERRLIISGSIHYPRSTHEMWPSLIQKAKEGGLNAIETYVFWNVHEPVRRQYDFTGNLDLVKFIKTIQDAGLYAILRIGPYVCAEWNYGGFPVWLHNLSKDMAFRTTNKIFMQEMETFTTKIVDMMKKENLFAPDGGPIILSQIENEFGNVEGDYGSDGWPYVQAVAEFADSLDTGVPWIMCQQDNALYPIVSTVNGFYGDQWHPPRDSIPKIWTESWSGWYQKWGEPSPHRPAEDLAFATARFFQLRGTLQNYYMYHGGTNFGRTSGGPYIITSYDYDAPLNEYGLPNQPKWGHLKQLHEVLRSVEKLLTYGDFVDKPYHGRGDLYMSTEFSHNGSRVCFFGNSDSGKAVTIDFEGQQITVPAWSVSIYRDCKTEIFNTARVNVTREVLERVRHQGPLKWTWRAEPIEAIKGQSDTFAPHFLEQKSATNDTSDYLWFMTSVDADEDDGCDPLTGHEVTLNVRTNGQVLHAFLNKKHIGSQWSPNGFTSFDLKGVGKIKPGLNTISLLSGTVGLPNYGSHFDTASMYGVSGPVTLTTYNGDNLDLSNGHWSYKVGMSGIDERKLFSDKERRGWKENPKLNKPLVWYKNWFLHVREVELYGNQQYLLDNYQ